MQRLAGSEEVLPAPDVNRFIDSSVPKEIELSIQTCLLKVKSGLHNLKLFSLLAVPTLLHEFQIRYAKATHWWKGL